MSHPKQWVLLEQTCHLAMPPLKVKLYLLEQATSIANSMDWKGEFIQECVYGYFARAIASKGCKVGIYDLLGFEDDAGTI